MSAYEAPNPGLVRDLYERPFKMVEYWTKSIVQRLLEIIGDLALFLINSVTVRGFTNKV